MDKISQSYETLLQAYSTLKDAIDDFQEVHARNESQRLQRTFPDSIVQRFEYCYELLWKYCKTYLFLYHQTEALSPKGVFIELYKKGITSRKEDVTLKEIADIRNLTSHTYNEEYVTKAAAEIIEHYQALEKILPKIKPIASHNR